MSKHTPGPWAFVPFKRHEHSYRDHEGDMGGFQDASGKWVCHFGDSTTYYPSEGVPPNASDALLIASAPDMLAALQRIAEYDEAPGAPVRSSVKKSAIARAAIAKATGDSE